MIHQKHSVFRNQDFYHSLPVTITVFFWSITDKEASFDQEQKNDHQMRSSQTGIMSRDSSSRSLRLGL